MIQSVLKALDVMRVFSPTEPYLTLAEISSRLDMPKSTVHNFLNTLASQDFIEKVNDDSYALGTAIISLTQSVRVNAELRDRAAPLLRELADLSKESIYLTSFQGSHVLYIYAIETPSRLMARTAIGQSSHMHCTGVGKAILAALPRDQVKDIVERQGMPAFTENTLTKLEQLSEELERIRTQGYAFDQQEHEVGTFCIAAKIQDARGRVIGACSISGKDHGIVTTRAVELSSRLLYTAQEISRQMGFVPARPSLLFQAMPDPDRRIESDTR